MNRLPKPLLEGAVGLAKGEARWTRPGGFQPSNPALGISPDPRMD